MGHTGVVALPPGYRDDGHLHFDASVGRLLRTGFDVGAYTRHAAGRIPIPPAGIELDRRSSRDVAYLWRLEVAALSDMRAVLASWTANEARITAFLATWAYERYWFARALSDLLDAVDAPRAAAAKRALTTRIRTIYVEHLPPLTAPLTGPVVGEPMTAGQMARMAIHEGALRSAQAALMTRLVGPARDVLAEIVRRRDNIVEFFELEAVARIRRSRTERVSAVLHLRKPWRPLQVVGSADPDAARALPSLFDTLPALAALAACETTISDLLPTRPTPAADVARTIHRRWRPAATAPSRRPSSGL